MPGQRLPSAFSQHDYRQLSVVIEFIEVEATPEHSMKRKNVRRVYTMG